MKSKPIVPRSDANRDVDEAIEHYLSENAESAALGFVDALERAYEHISRHAATGSPRYAHTLNIPGLRFWPLTRYPYLVFYIEFDDHIDVWRMLHGQRDIPAWLVTDTDSESVFALPKTAVLRSHNQGHRHAFVNAATKEAFVYGRWGKSGVDLPKDRDLRSTTASVRVPKVQRLAVVGSAVLLKNQNTVTSSR
jgi:toxin ParE1/3/4